tara:strand:+ start:27883 stop:29787 length:1905 start_codon:yes stop_codon:yes gene_type:complete
MQTPKEILLKYWGYSSFRENQEEIIKMILNNKDTLALLPTGGGKSICYQIPSLIMDGICIVVSPLISLMKDQVEDIKSKGIKAIALTSDLDFKEVDIALTNCIFGGYKFLYISPEKLHNELVQSKISEMNVNLIAVDEAHCISKWGNDFRPSYRNISLIREIYPEIPVLALTATATKDIVSDIQENLNFKEPNLIQSSFYRENLSYVVIKEQDKNSKLINILKKINGSAIIYVKSRKDCVKISKMLIDNNISANYYHGGLNIEHRNKRQENWKESKSRVMVATNAFGMGIDKSDVRLVIHFHIPSTIESYFQETGRAGRDEKESFAVLLYNNTDEKYLRDFVELHFPSIKEIKECYQNLANYFQIAVNNGAEEKFDFDLSDYSAKYNINSLKTYNILKYLEKENYLKLEDIYNHSSKIHLKIEHSELNKFQISNKYFDPYIKLLLRSYSGLFEDYVNINETLLAGRSKTNKNKIIEVLKKMQELEILDYLPKKQGTQIIYLQNRVDEKYLHLSEEKQKKNKDSEIKRMNFILNYCNQNSTCRTEILLSYFGENQKFRCEKCDICRQRNKLAISDLKFNKIKKKVFIILSEESKTLIEICNLMKDFREEKIIKVINFLIENSELISEGNKIRKQT